MEKSRFSQIAHTLRQAEAGAPVAELVRKLGISNHVLFMEEASSARWARPKSASYDSCAQQTQSSGGSAVYLERAARWEAVSNARRLDFETAAQAVSDNDPIDSLWLTHEIAAVLDDNCIVFDETLPTPLHRMTEALQCGLAGSYFQNPGSSGGWAPGAAFGAKSAERSWRQGYPWPEKFALCRISFVMRCSPSYFATQNEAEEAQIVIERGVKWQIFHRSEVFIRPLIPAYR